MNARSRTSILIFLTAVLAGAAPSSAVGQRGFTVAIRPPVQNPQKHTRYQQWLQQSQMLQQLARSVNQGFNIPQQAYITGAECGQENAFWQPEQRVVVICYEMIDAIFKEFQNDGLTPEQFGTAVASSTIFIVMHEVGHALVDLLDLPVTGREEDVVDQFATIALAQDSPELALWAAVFWRTKNDLGDIGVFRADPTPFDDEHSFDMQRFYNVLCWTYGKDPQNRGQILSELPQGRAARCPGEYQRMASSWDRILAPHQRGATTLPPPPRAPRVANVGGTWDIVEQIGSLTSDFYCESRIQMNVQQLTQVFTAPYRQTGRCTINGQQIDNPGNGEIERGTVDANGMRFQMETCNYAGVLQAGSPNVIVGNLACAVNQEDGTTRTVNGVWRATRR